MTRFKVVVTKNAAKDINKLDHIVKKRLKKKILFFIAQDNPLFFAEYLTDSEAGQYRWRVGVYRIVFDVMGDEIVVLRVQHRRQVYRK